MIKAVIIDDEKDCRDALNNLINDLSSDVYISGQADSIETGVELIKVKNPDIVFLDVELTDGTGFDLLGKLKNYNFNVIFVTAFDQYAIQAIRHSAIDYILKPINPEILKEALEKSKRLNQNVDLLSQQVKLLMENKSDFNRIALPTIDGLRFINLDDIVFCKSDSNYTWFHLKNNEKILVTKTLKEYSETLSDKLFVRIHQSYLINIKYVEKYIKGEGGSVIMTDGTEINVSRRRKEYFLSQMKGRY